MDKEITKEFAIEAVCRNGLYLEQLPQKHRDDKDVVIAATKTHGDAIKYASPRLRGDRDVVLAALQNDKYAIMWASPALWDDKDIMLIAKSAPMPQWEPYDIDVVVGCLSPRLRLDRELNGYLPEFQFPHHLINWSDWVEEKKEHQKRMDETYGAWRAERIQHWNESTTEWEKHRNDENLSVYKKLRKEIEAMPKYETWRQQVFAKCGRRCQKCGATKNLETDHHPDSFYSIIKSENITDIDSAYESISLWDVDNGWVLCHDCHERTQSSQKYNELSLR